MAQDQKNSLPPTLQIPDAIVTLMSGFDEKIEKNAQLIFEQAIKLVSKNNKLTRRDLKSGYAIFRTINPEDDIEKVLCAQFIILHLLGMNKLSEKYQRDRHIGLKLIKEADKVMELIHRKRDGSPPEDLYFNTAS